MSRCVVSATWANAPHLSEEMKKALWDSIPEFQRDARTKGIPQLGSGAIYPFSESSVRVPAFDVPDFWKRAFGLDTALSGTTAIVWGALDPESKTLYITSVYKRAQAETAVHVEAIKSRGLWIQGVGDAADVLDEDRTQFIDLYRRHGVNLMLPDKAVETGIQSVYDMLSAGKLKVFHTCPLWFDEFRMYQRDDKGRVVKQNDHLMDACVTGDVTVSMADGTTRRIDSLVGKTGRVLTRDGATAEFIGAHKTRTNSPVVALVFEDGSTITCTPDHPFLTPDGWVRADNMASKSCYNGVAQRILCHSILPRRIRNFVANGITCAGTTTSETAGVSIGKSGWPRTDRSPKDSPFTTSTTISITTTSRIWPWWNADSTRHSTSAGTVVGFQPKLWLPHVSGIGVMPAANGTSSITSYVKINYTAMGISSAINVDDHTDQESQDATVFAPTPAKLKRVTRLALTMSNVVAWLVAKSLWLIATKRNARVHANALLRCVNVSEAGCADVYCLTVPGTSAFVLGNGAVVHNTRYLVRSGLARMKKKPEPAPEEHLLYDVGKSNLAWMR